MGSVEPAVKLTERQLVIVRMMARGMTTEDIGAELDINPRTVKAHLDAVRHKLRLKRRREIPMTLHKMGIDVYPR